MFDTLNSVAIHCAALCGKDAAGQLGVNVFCVYFIFPNFNNLCSRLPCRHLCMDMVDPNEFSACHLIPLDKCPGDTCRPFGVSEVLEFFARLL